jgi:hypothetical protein
VQIFSDHARNPNNEPSKFFAHDFKGKFARFGFSDLSASIENDWSIFRAIDNTGKRPSAFVAQRVRARYASLSLPLQNYSLELDGLMESGRADRQTPLAAAVWKDTWPAKVRDGDEKAAA